MMESPKIDLSPLLWMLPLGFFSTVALVAIGLIWLFRHLTIIWH